MNRDFITVSELTDDELDVIYEKAVTVTRGNELHGVGVGLVFEFPSLRTRASSVAAVQLLGGRFCMFSGDEVGLDSRESAEDVARTLLATCEVVALRVRDHGVFARMQAATDGALRLINLLSNRAHPTQAVADVLTLADRFSEGDVHRLSGRSVAYVGDATNVTHSLAEALVRLGVEVRVGAPQGYQLSDDDVRLINQRARDGGVLVQFADPVAAVNGVDAVYTDSWISMGLEAEAHRRRRDLANFQVNRALMQHAAAHAVVLHCLPAHRGEEITDEVLDGPNSLVWEQVRHRTSSMVGVLQWMKGSTP